MGKPRNVETPWEFYPDDDLRESPPLAAEVAAMHIEQVGSVVESAAEDDSEVVVHYLHDEEPEVPDLTEPTVDTTSTVEVDELLEEQHYLSPEDDSV